MGQIMQGSASTTIMTTCAGHLSDFIKAYNFGRRLKTLKGLTPYEFICKQWTSEPQRFNINPIHQMKGLDI